VTLQTIADALGVSRTTVSNAYNRPDQLAPALRERILTKARELGYSGPDPAARRLRSGRRDVVGLLFTEKLSYAFTDPGAVMLLQGFASAVEAAGLSVLIVPEHRADARSPVHDVVVDAFCIYSMPDGHPHVLAALERRLPIVVVDEPRLEGHGFIGIEDRRGARLAAEHLLELGHRRIAVMCETHEDEYLGPLTDDREASVPHEINRHRLGGYRETLEAAGIEWHSIPRVEMPASHPQRGLEGGRLVLDAEPRPTAILAGTDQIALGVLEAVRERGLSVPGDVSVVGFDDVPSAAWAQPSLTTVRQPLLEKGELAGRLLIGEATEREIILPVELVVRGSTGPAPT
jgi:DNA-binding LacI/PurR family transcriptional regulator